MMKCERHGDCMRKRGKHPQFMAEFGALEPAAWLDVWRDIPDGGEPGWKHTTCRVPQQQVRERMAEADRVAVYQAIIDDMDH